MYFRCTTGLTIVLCLQVVEHLVAGAVIFLLSCCNFGVYTLLPLINSIYCSKYFGQSLLNLEFGLSLPNEIFIGMNLLLLMKCRFTKLRARIITPLACQISWMHASTTESPTASRGSLTGLAVVIAVHVCPQLQIQMKLRRPHRFCHSRFVKYAFQFVIVVMVQQRSLLNHIKFILLLLLLLLHHSHHTWGFVHVGKLSIFIGISFLSIWMTSQR